MKIYRIEMYWDGKGYADVWANSEEEAKEVIYSGEWDDTDLHDESDNYCVERVTELKDKPTSKAKNLKS